MGTCTTCLSNETVKINPSKDSPWSAVQFQSIESQNGTKSGDISHNTIQSSAPSLGSNAMTSADLQEYISKCKSSQSSSRRSTPSKSNGKRSSYLNRNRSLSSESMGNVRRRNSNAFHSNEQTITAEDIISSTLSKLHEIINKQADMNTIDQKELLSLIIYLQKPRKLIGGMSRQKMLRVEAQHTLDALQHKDSGVSTWMQNVMNIHVSKSSKIEPNNERDKTQSLDITTSSPSKNQQKLSLDPTQQNLPKRKNNLSRRFSVIVKAFDDGIDSMANGISNITSGIRLTKMYRMINTNKGLKQCFASIHDYEFNAFALLQFTNRPLALMSLYAMDLFDLFNKFHIRQTVFFSFIEKIESLYKDNPYHNSIHAADVLAAELFWLTNSESVISKLEAIDFLTCIIGAVIHDVGHPGTTSDFEIRTGSDIAIQYNDTSVLENYHLSVTFNILKKRKFNIFQLFSSKIRKETRRALIQMVLTTDISKHLEHVALIKDYLLQKELISDIYAVQNDPSQSHTQNVPCLPLKRTNSSYKSYRVSVTESHELNTESFMTRSEIRALLRNISLKVSDLSNPTRPLNIALLWTDRIMSEFVAQGDKERDLGFSVTPTMDRHRANIALSQIAFIDHIIIPLYESWFQLANVAVLSLQNLIIVRNYWIQKVEERTNTEQSMLRKKNDELRKLIDDEFGIASK